LNTLFIEIAFVFKLLFFIPYVTIRYKYGTFTCSTPCVLPNNPSWEWQAGRCRRPWESQGCIKGGATTVKDERGPGLAYFVGAATFNFVVFIY